MRTTNGLGLVMAACLAAAAPACAAPDLSGLWSNNSLTYLERPDDFKTLVITPELAKAYEAKHLGKPPEDPEDTVGGNEAEWWDTDVGLLRVRGQIRTSEITSPADGQLPFTAETRKRNKARSARRKVNFDGPEDRSRGERCLGTDSAGPPMLNGGYNDNFKFVQTPDTLAILAEYMNDVRIVRLAPGAAHPPLTVRRAMGDSIGHWEGQTLVIETTNFIFPEVGEGAAADADMTVVERITRTGPGELHYAFWVRNPTQFTQPWAGELMFHAAKGPIYEFACHEGNYALPNILSAARQAEARARAAFASMGR